MNIRDLTRAFNREYRETRTETAINSALTNRGIKCFRKPKNRLYSSRLRIYTEEQTAFIKENYKGRSIKDMTALFNSRFRAEKTELQIRSFVHNRSITSGRTGRFPKGHKPWNTGSKGQGLTRANITSFKKGDIPANRKPIGSERIDSKDGFVLIKIRECDPYTGFPTRYKLKHVRMWEKANGPVPEGMVVAFVDGDRTRCELDNLMLISRAQLLYLNGHGYRDTPDELKPSLLALSKLAVKTFEKAKNLNAG